MTANDDSPSGDKSSDGASDDSIARSLVEDEISELDRHADRAATRAVRAGREDLLNELTEHLREVADFLEDYGGEKLEESCDEDGES